MEEKAFYMQLTEARTLTDASASLADRVYEATAQLMLEVGARKLRTADVAKRAGIPESTLFRNIGKIQDLLQGTDEWAWERVIAHVSRATFTSPIKTPIESLLADTEAIWQMHENEADRAAATFAFLFFRRGHELDLKPTEHQQIFLDRVRHSCSSITDAQGVKLTDERARVLATMVLNYIATVWLTWEVLPAGSSDVFEAHDLSPDEAQMGLHALIERAVGPTG